MNRLQKIYSVVLLVLVPVSAISAMIQACPMSALVCGLMAIALAWEQYQALRAEDSRIREKMIASAGRVEAVEGWLHSITDEMSALKCEIKDLNLDDVKARSEEIRSTLNSMKLNGLYSRR